MKKLFVLFLQISALTLSAQTFERLDAPVSANDAPLASAWSGGVNAPQWSAVDVDNDGTNELYAFDRDGHVHLIFRSLGNGQYAFAPDLLPIFPPAHDYVLLRDYNQDGAMDLFAFAGDEGIAGLKVFTGSYQNGLLAFERLEVPQFGPDVLTVPINGGTAYTNLNVSRPDYPAIADADGDGDLDIVGVNSVSGSTFIYYQNLALEQGHTLDTLVFVKGDDCWMRVFIPTITDSLELSCSPDLCADDCLTTPPTNDDRSGGPAHGAGALALLDQNNDGLPELLYGDLQYPNVMCAKNTGTPDNPWATQQDVFFPSYDVSVDLANFPASFLLDADQDGRTDYLTSPNTSGASIRDWKNVWHYQNIGTEELPVFSLLQEDYLVQDMLDFGTVAQPAFFDHNGDGLLDFLVGNFSRWTTSDQPNESFLVLFENTGTATEPAFSLVDDNYLNFKQYSSLTQAFAPAFGDLDEDGDLDLLVGEQGGSLFFVENNGGAGNPVSWGPVLPSFQSIDVGQNATPFIFDVNTDGRPDLVIGEQNGTVNYLPNQGTAGDPVFHPDPDEAPNNKFFGEINTQNSMTGSATGFSAPVLLPSGDSVYVLTGSEIGHVEVYLLDPANIDGGPFPLISEDFGQLEQGRFTRLALANLNDDDHYEALVGNRRGGLGLFRSPFAVAGGLVMTSAGQQSELGFSVFPNPTSGQLFLRLPAATTAGQFRLFSPLGQVALQGKISGPESSLQIGHLPSGVYFLQVETDGQQGVQRVVLSSF